MFVTFQEKEEVVAAKESKYNIILRLGDPSEDGHGKTCEFNYVFNKSKDEIFSAYKEGAKKIGFDLINEVAIEYEDATLDEARFKKLKGAGFDCSYIYTEEDAESVKYVNEEDYISIFLFFVKEGDPSIIYEELNCEVMDIGGYGLFY